MPQSQVPRLLGGRELASPLPALGLCALCFQRTDLWKGPLPRWDRWRVGGWGLSSGLALAVKQSAPIHVYDSMDGELQGSGEVAAPGQGRLAGGAAVFDNFSISMNVRTLRVDPNIWDAMKKER